MKEEALCPPWAGAADQARAWRAGLPGACRRRSDWRGGLIFALSASLFVLVFLGMFLLPFWWLRAAALAAQPLVIGALFVIGHDACHGSLVRTGWLNRALGRAALLPAWHPYTSWIHAHNTLHHGATCLKGREPAFPPFTKGEFDRLPLWRRLLERLYRTPPGIGVYYAVDFYLRRLLFPPPGQRPPARLAFHLDRVAVVAFLAVQLLAARALAGARSGDVLPPGVYAVIAVVVPWGLWIWFMGFVSFIQHTHPRIAWYDREDEWSFYHVQLKSTAHVVFPWPVGSVLHNIMEHAAHHLDPAIPLYELPRSQRLLEQECPEHAVVIPWTLAEFFRTCACCKLYDFRRHCWTDFNGVPTTPTGLNGRPSAVANFLPKRGNIYQLVDSHTPIR
jgi:omega-6 fatty acid desaturase (delta-12 desaturase)